MRAFPGPLRHRSLCCSRSADKERAVTSENQIMDLLTRRRGRLFCDECIALELQLPTLGPSKPLSTRLGRPRDFAGPPARAAGAAGSARALSPGGDCAAAPTYRTLANPLASTFREHGTPAA